MKMPAQGDFSNEPCEREQEPNTGIEAAPSSPRPFPRRGEAKTERDETSLCCEFDVLVN